MNKLGVEFMTCIKRISALVICIAICISTIYATDFITERDEEIIVNTVNEYDLEVTDRQADDSIDEESRNEIIVLDYLLTEMKFNTAVSCGILANIKQESSFRSDILGDYGTSYGICQWHNERFSDLKDFCYANNYDYTDVYGQLAYLKYELENKYASMISYLRSLPNNEDGAYESGYYWCTNFERPTDVEVKSDSRGNMAVNRYYSKWKYYTRLNTSKTYESEYYQDIKAGSYNEKCVRAAYETGIMDGNGDKFMPSSTITVGELIVIAVKLNYLYNFGKLNELDENTPKFRQYCYNYAYENDIISKDMYKSNMLKIATKADLAEILSNSLPWPSIYNMYDYTYTDIKDVKSTDKYADSILKLYNAGVLYGKEFNPTDNVTRIQVADAVYRLVDTANRA